MTSGSVPPAGLNPAPPSTSEGLSIEDLKEQGNLAFKRAALLKRTTASTQYLSEAKSYYIQAIQRVGNAKANASNLALGCALHSNLAAVYLQEVPPQWTHAKAAADIALAFNPEHVKARFRRAQAFLEDNREGLPEDAIRKALADLLQAQQQEPANAQIANEVKRVTRRLEVSWSNLFQPVFLIAGATAWMTMAMPGVKAIPSSMSSCRLKEEDCRRRALLARLLPESCTSLSSLQRAKASFMQTDACTNR